MRDGIINLLKPAGMTSHDGVSFMRRLTGVKRIGHTGTLDPMAVGVLPICIGSAARITEYLDLDYKKYRCEMQLGLKTDTQDIWGNIIADNRAEIGKITEQQIIDVLGSFKGIISQYPPNYSAVRVNGKRLYEYARKGETVEVKSRKVDVKDITVNRIDLTKGLVTFDVVCSKGTYIRTICEDAGNMLGVSAAMSFLVRTGSGAFSIENTVTIEQLTQGNVEDYLLDIDFPLVHFGKAYVNQERAKWFVNGGHLRMSEVTILQEPEFKNSSNEFIGREEYKLAYNIYLNLDDDNNENENDDSNENKKYILNDKSNLEFLGVAFYNHDYKKLVADKVFQRQGAKDETI